MTITLEVPICDMSLINPLCELNRNEFSLPCGTINTAQLLILSLDG
jgi:hypothetical protein